MLHDLKDEIDIILENCFESNQISAMAKLNSSTIFGKPASLWNSPFDLYKCVTVNPERWKALQYLEQSNQPEGSSLIIDIHHWLTERQNEQIYRLYTVKRLDKNPEQYWWEGLAVPDKYSADCHKRIQIFPKLESNAMAILNPWRQCRNKWNNKSWETDGPEDFRLASSWDSLELTSKYPACRLCR